MDICIVSFNLNCIMQLKQFYNIATKVSSRQKCYYFWWSTWQLKQSHAFPWLDHVDPQAISLVPLARISINPTCTIDITLKQSHVYPWHDPQAIPLVPLTCLSSNPMCTPLTWLSSNITCTIDLTLKKPHLLLDLILPQSHLHLWK